MRVGGVERPGTAAEGVVSATALARTAVAALVLAFGLPFGGPDASPVVVTPAILLQPMFEHAEARLTTRADGSLELTPGTGRIRLVPFLVPAGRFSRGATLPGRMVPARLAIAVLLLGAALAGSRATAWARAATTLGGALLVGAGGVAALPSPGALAALVGAAASVAAHARARRNVGADTTRPVSPRA